MDRAHVQDGEGQVTKIGIGVAVGSCKHEHCRLDIAHAIAEGSSRSDG